MTIDALDDGGFQITAPGYGAFAITRDGGRVSCMPSQTSAWRWQRYLIGQALPLASLLQGLETFHASAVVMDGKALAYVGASHVGKTTLALHSTLHGARFLTDDVLALEAQGGTVTAHPGPAVASLRPPAVRALGTRLNSIAEPVGRDEDGLRVELRSIAPSAPLAGLIFLARGSGGRSVTVEPLHRPDPRALLTASFNFLVADSARLLRQLDVCAQVARSVRVYRVHIPSGVAPDAVASAILSLWRSPA